jgi:TolB-like protein/Flp pilus assembly protein TadD
MSFWAELRRRNVVKVGIAYLIVAWLTVQVVDVLRQPLDLPNWLGAVVVVLLGVGFPIALILAWAYEITPEGVKKTRLVPLEESIRHLTAQKLNYVMTVLLVLAVGFIVLDNYVLDESVSAVQAERDTAGAGRAGTSAARDLRSIAVLPFANRSAEPEDEFFVAGIHDDILSQLARISSLKVISRTSVMGYQDSDKRLRTIGEELGVATILEGGVQRAGDTVRINVQLIDAQTDEHLWASTYDRELNTQNIFAIQTEMATLIAEALRATISPEEAAQISGLPTESTRAYDAYVRGRFFWNQRTQEGFNRALEYFNEAIEEDPNYALAHAGIASVYVLLGHELFAFDRAADTYPKAKAAARRALELDETLADAHAVLAYSHLLYDRDWDAAEREYERALALNPNYATAYQWYSHYLLPMGRKEESLARSEKAVELDPLSLVINMHLGWHHAYSGDNDLAIAQLKRTLELGPTFVFAKLFLGQVYERQGRFDEAIAEFASAVELSDRAPVHVAALAHAYGLAGRQAEAETLLQELLAGEKPVPSYEVAIAYVGLGRRDEALTWLERAYEERDSTWLVDMGIDPRLEPLRREPRFQDLMRRLDLPSAAP